MSRCESEFSAPVLVIKKPCNPDGSSRGYRLVTNFRALNDCINNVQHYILDIHEMFDKLKGAKCISALDMKDGYWSAGIHPESRHLTAFSCEFGSFCYNVLSQIQNLRYNSTTLLLGHLGHTP
eukprot:SAG11_NODE_808_length_7088_cov_5.136357_9_plen_123_part_00